MTASGSLSSVIKAAKFQLMETHSDKVCRGWGALHWNHSTQNTVTSDFLPGHMTHPHLAFILLCQVTHQHPKNLSARSREVHAFLGRHVELCITPVADLVLWIPFPPSPP